MLMPEADLRFEVKLHERDGRWLVREVAVRLIVTGLCACSRRWGHSPVLAMPVDEQDHARCQS